MVLANLYLKNCLVCGIRCDKMGKNNILEIKTTEFRDKILTFYTDKNPQVGDYMCRKHEEKIRKSTLSLTEESNTPLSIQSNFLASDQALATSPNDKTFESSNSSNDYDSCVIYDTQNDNIINDENANSYVEDRNEKQLNESAFIMVNIPRTYASHSFCFICKAKSGKSFTINIRMHFYE